jgi:integrase/recombinase XerD
LRLLEAGVDTRVIALSLGHECIETTHIYLFADLDLKERALDRTRPLASPPGRYQPPDDILTWLDAL